MRRLLLSLIPKRAPVVSLSLFFTPRLFLVGVLVDRQVIYICPLPMFGISISWRMEDV